MKRKFLVFGDQIVMSYQYAGQKSGDPLASQMALNAPRSDGGDGHCDN